MDEEARKPGRDDEESADELIERLAPDGQPDVVRLVGFGVGKSTRKDHVRLWLSSELKQYCDVPKDKIVASKRFVASRVVIWVKPDTRLQCGTLRGRSAEFLEGVLRSRFLPGTRGLVGFLSKMARMAGDGDTVCICLPPTDAYSCGGGSGDSCGLCTTEARCP